MILGNIKGFVIIKLILFCRLSSFRSRLVSFRIKKTLYTDMQQRYLRLCPCRITANISVFSYKTAQNISVFSHKIAKNILVNTWKALSFLSIKWNIHGVFRLRQHADACRHLTALASTCSSSFTASTYCAMPSATCLAAFMASTTVCGRCTTSPPAKTPRRVVMP